MQASQTDRDKEGKTSDSDDQLIQEINSRLAVNGVITWDHILNIYHRDENRNSGKRKQPFFKFKASSIRQIQNQNVQTFRERQKSKM